MTDESMHCPECERLQGELDVSRSLHNHALLKAREAYDQGHEQGAAHVAVEIIAWLEGLAATTSLADHGALYKRVAEGIMDADYMPEEPDGVV